MEMVLLLEQEKAEMRALWAECQPMATLPRGQYLKMATLTSQKLGKCFQGNLVKIVQDSETIKRTRTSYMEHTPIISACQCLHQEDYEFE